MDVRVNSSAVIRTVVSAIFAIRIIIIEIIAFVSLPIFSIMIARRVYIWHLQLFL